MTWCEITVNLAHMATRTFQIVCLQIFLIRHFGASLILQHVFYGSFIILFYQKVILILLFKVTPLTENRFESDTYFESSVIMENIIV